jgi:hypothetical protein
MHIGSPSFPSGLGTLVPLSGFKKHAFLVVAAPAK